MKYRAIVEVEFNGRYVKQFINAYAPVLKKAELINVQEVSAICRRCGCTAWEACPGGCEWVEADLCSACAPALKKKVSKPRDWRAELRKIRRPSKE